VAFKKNDAMLEVLQIEVIVFHGTSKQDNLVDKARMLAIPVFNFRPNRGGGPSCLYLVAYIVGAGARATLGSWLRRASASTSKGIVNLGWRGEAASNIPPCLRLPLEILM
jgi:hypothetical protein